MAIYRVPEVNPQEIVRDELYQNLGTAEQYAERAYSAEVQGINFSREGRVIGKKGEGVMAWEILSGERGDTLANQARLEQLREDPSADPKEIARLEVLQARNNRIETAARALQLVEADQQRLNEKGVSADEQRVLRNRIAQNMIVTRAGMRAFEQKYGLEQIKTDYHTDPGAWRIEAQRVVARSMGINTRSAAGKAEADALVTKIEQMQVTGETPRQVIDTLDSSLAGVPSKGVRGLFVRKYRQAQALNAVESLLWREHPDLEETFANKWGLQGFRRDLVARAEQRMQVEHGEIDVPTERQEQAVSVAEMMMDEVGFKRDILDPAAAEVRVQIEQAENDYNDAEATVTRLTGEVTALTAEITQLQTEIAQAKTEKEKAEKIKALQELQEKQLKLTLDVKNAAQLKTASIVMGGSNTPGNFAHLKTAIDTMASSREWTTDVLYDLGYTGKNTMEQAGKDVSVTIKKEIETVNRLLNDLEKNQTALTALQAEFVGNASLAGEWTADDTQLLTLQQEAVNALLLARDPLNNLEAERVSLQESFERFRGTLRGGNPTHIERESKALRQAMDDFDQMHTLYLEAGDPANPGTKVQDGIDTAFTALEGYTNNADVKQRREQRKTNYLESIKKADSDTKAKNEAITAKTKTKGEKEKELTDAEKTRDEKKAARDKITKEATIAMATKLARSIAERAQLPEDSQLEGDLETYLKSPEAQSLMKGKESNISLWFLLLSFLMGTFKQEHAAAQRRADANA